MNGYALLHKKIQHCSFYKSPNEIRLFIHLFMNANYEDKVWRGKITVKRGQLITSLGHLADELGMTKSTVRSALLRLSTRNEQSVFLSDNSTDCSTVDQPIYVQFIAQSYTLITICKYDYYQSPLKSLANSFSNRLRTEKRTEKQSVSLSDSRSNINKSKEKKNESASKKMPISFELINQAIRYYSRQADEDLKLTNACIKSLEKDNWPVNSINYTDYIINFLKK